MSDKEWAEDNIDMGDYLARADEPPTISDKYIEGASSIAEVPMIATHLPDPTHLSTPEESPHTKEDDDTDKPISNLYAVAADDDPEAEEEMTTTDVIIEEEYLEQQEEEELDCEDDAPVEESEQVIEESEQDVEVNKNEETTVTEVKEPSGNSWGILSMNEPALTLTQVRPQASWSLSWGSRVPKVNISPVKVVATFVADVVIDSILYWATIVGILAGTVLTRHDRQVGQRTAANIDENIQQVELHTPSHLTNLKCPKLQHRISRHSRSSWK